MSEKEPLDKIGREIKVGSYIAYGHALGRCAALAIGKVLDIKYGPAPGYSTHMQWSISVWGIDDNWEGCPPKLNCTKGTLMFPNRILVLGWVPPEYKTLLEPLTKDSKAKRVKTKEGYRTYEWTVVQSEEK